jgi:hypothetical protein
VLCLWLSNSDLHSSVVAWSHFDGASNEPRSCNEATPPYANAVAAMRDGWRVLHMSLPQRLQREHAYDTDYLQHAVILERFVEISS